MILLLARHGNTFRNDETPVWVGSEQDLPLTPEGEDQARELSRALVFLSGKISDLFVAPLQRTTRFGEILHNQLSVSSPMIVDSRLTEINYGSWGGLSTGEVTAKFGASSIEEWERLGKWPIASGWQPSREAIESRVRSLVAELRTRDDSYSLCVSSNGILRFFLTCIPGEFDRSLNEGWAKMRTGALGALRFSEGVGEVLFWNKSAIEIMANPELSQKLL